MVQPTTTDSVSYIMSLVCEAEQSSKQKPTTVTKPAPYSLGNSQEELNRLLDQARFFGDLTEEMLRLAGIQPGMRVLNIGGGTGDISFLAAGLVGPSGEVVGVDKSAEAIALATQRAAEAGLTNVHFVTADLADYTPDAIFDALIGRLVLMYFADPAVLLRRLATFVRPGGVVAFQEFDAVAAKSEPSCPLFELSVQRIFQTLMRVGADGKAGLKLAQIFEEAGLPIPTMRQSARVERGPDAQIYAQVAGVTRSILPLMERTGVATRAEVEVETLAERLCHEAVTARATLIAPPLIGAWAHKPAA